MGSDVKSEVVHCLCHTARFLLDFSITFSPKHSPRHSALYLQFLPLGEQRLCNLKYQDFVYLNLFVYLRCVFGSPFTDRNTEAKEEEEWLV